ncbi:MAG: hypothetical protein ACP5QO_15995 [Clostridia bacterium]
MTPRALASTRLVYPAEAGPVRHRGLSGTHALNYKAELDIEEIARPSTIWSAR